MKEIINKIRAYYNYSIILLQAHFISASLKYACKWLNTNNLSEEDLDSVRAIYEKRRAHKE